MADPGSRLRPASGSSSGLAGSSPAGPRRDPDLACPSSRRSPKPTAAPCFSRACRTKGPPSRSEFRLWPARNHCRKQGYDVSRILIAEDEARIASFVEKGLRAAGFAVTVSADGRDALALAQTGQFDLMILDVGLPGRDGFDILRTLRGETNPIAVIMLTARDSAADTLHGLEGGADDYMSKPFRFDELLARVRLRLKDAQPGPAGALQVRDLGLDLKTRRISVGGTWHDLSGREFALAEEFLRHPDQVLGREQLLSRVWGLDFDPGSNVVEVYVRYLRAKIGADRIETIRGMGCLLYTSDAAD